MLQPNKTDQTQPQPHLYCLIRACQYFCFLPNIITAFFKNKRDGKPSLLRALDILFDFGGLTDSATQVIKLGASDFALAHNFEFFDVGGMYRESLFDADAI